MPLRVGVELKRTDALIFCVTGKSGLGHLRRVTNIATAIKRISAATELHLVANAAPDGLSPDERNLFEATHVVERRHMARRISSLPHGPVASDTAVVPDLELLPRRLILILRETVDARLASFRMPAGRQWDVSIVPAPWHQWSVAAQTIGARRVENVGWIYRRPQPGAVPVLPPGRDDERTVLIATGGGGKPGTARAFNAEIDLTLARLRALFGGALRILQVVGPRAPQGSALSEADALIDVGSRLDEAFAEADLVISTTGYNSVLELATVDTPTLLCPIVRTYDDQPARAAAWSASLGLDHRPGDPGRSAEWMAGVLSRNQRRAAIDLGPCGSKLAAERLLAQTVEPLAPSVAHRKPHGPDMHAIARALPRRTHALFARGVPTLPCVVARDSESMIFARLEGDTATAAWQSASETDRRRLAVEIITPLVALHRASHSTLKLQPIDVWRRITPRIASRATEKLLGPARLGHILAIAHRLQVIQLSRNRVDKVVHGDFHLGQLIRPRGRPDFVLIDLDDLALGEPESDIGNLAAYIATGGTGHQSEAVIGLLHLLGNAYVTCAQDGLNPVRLRWHTAVALLRRALKLAERGCPPATIDDIVATAAALAGSTPHEAAGNQALVTAAYANVSNDQSSGRPK